MKTAFVRHLIVCAAALVLADAWADTWIDPDTGYTWTYRITGNTAEIYNGGFCAVLPEPAGAVTIPSVLGGKPVASIGQHAFYGCSGLACVTIPDCVISIEEEAFDGCSSSLFDVTTISGVRLVDGWVVGNLGALEGDLNLIGVRGIANHAFDG